MTSVTRLLLWFDSSLFPSKETAAFVLKKKNVMRIIAELSMYGKTETTRLSFKSDMIANAASVIPTAKDPVFPTKIFPRKLSKASSSHTISGHSRRIASDPEAIISPIMTIAGQMVSRPLNPPNWLTVLVIIVTSNGIITK